MTQLREMIDFYLCEGLLMEYVKRRRKDFRKRERRVKRTPEQRLNLAKRRIEGLEDGLYKDMMKLKWDRMRLKLLKSKAKGPSAENIQKKIDMLDTKITKAEIAWRKDVAAGRRENIGDEDVDQARNKYDLKRGLDRIANLKRQL